MGKPPLLTSEGLVRVEHTRLDLLYAKPGLDLGGYRRIALLHAEVAFREGWDRDRRSERSRIRPEDVERIENDVARELGNAFLRALQGDGVYEVVEEPAAGVLLLRPAIVDLDVSAPDLLAAGRGRTLSASSGSATLLLEIYDGGTLELLLRAVDRRRARTGSTLVWQSRATNLAQARRTFDRWARLLRDVLDDARGEAGE
jgi:hypothetical protein